MELPIEMTYEANTLSLLNSMDHQQPLINGFSGYLPAHYHALSVALKDGDATALDAIREVGPIAAFVETARDRNGTEATLVAALTSKLPMLRNWLAEMAQVAQQ